MPFANDIVLVEETRSGVNAKLEIWWLEFEGFWLSGTKTEYIDSKFSGIISKNKEVVRLDGQEMSKSYKFQYFGSISHKYGEIEEDVNYRIKSGWMKWKSASRVLCDYDHRMPIKL